jgi:transposase
MVLQADRYVKRALRLQRRRTKDKGLAMRCQIVLLAAKGLRRKAIAEAVDYSVSGVDRVLARFRASGMSGLEDRRQDNGDVKLDEHYLATLIEVVGRSPRDYGHRRPTWTRELLVTVMAKQTGVRINAGTMSRALRRIGARRGRPRPTVGCPWSKPARTRRIRMLQRLIDALPVDEVAVWEDEVDVHLNPKIGLDWMNRGQQKEVLTPGQNQKRYLAGAMDAVTGVLTWVESGRKNSDLFIALLKQLARAHPQAKKIHVILDNFRIHHSRITQQAIEAFGGRIVLHFLPPYCPQHNRIERVWLDLHANVTRNHNHALIEDLMKDVRADLRRRNRGRHRELRRVG